MGIHKRARVADPSFHLPGRVDLILGANIIDQILLPEISQRH